MNSIKKQVRRGAAAAMTVVAMAGAGVAVTAGPAQAAVVCNPNWTMVNGQGYTVAEVDYNVKNGPYGACGHVGKIKKGTKFYLWCLTTNDYDNNWWYGRIAGTQIMGWVHQDTLGRGSFSIEDDSPDDGRLNLETCGPRAIWP